MTELRLLRPVEYSAVTVLYALSKKERHASQIVLSILSFIILSYLQVGAGHKDKKASVIEDSCLGGEQHENDGRCYLYSIAQPGEYPSPPGLKQRRSQLFWLAATEIQRLAVLLSERPVYLSIAFSSFLRLAQDRELEVPL